MIEVSQLSKYDKKVFLDAVSFIAKCQQEATKIKSSKRDGQNLESENETRSLIMRLNESISKYLSEIWTDPVLCDDVRMYITNEIQKNFNLKIDNVEEKVLRGQLSERTVQRFIEECNPGNIFVLMDKFDLFVPLGPPHRPYDNLSKFSDRLKLLNKACLCDNDLFRHHDKTSDVLDIEQLRALKASTIGEYQTVFHEILDDYRTRNKTIKKPKATTEVEQPVQQTASPQNGSENLPEPKETKKKSILEKIDLSIHTAINNVLPDSIINKLNNVLDKDDDEAYYTTHTAQLRREKQPWKNEKEK